MAEPGLLVLSVPHDLSPRIGSLTAMLRYGRHTTLGEVRGLSQAQLDHLHDSESNSIGALLHHIASIEWVYQLITFEGRDPICWNGCAPAPCRSCTSGTMRGSPSNHNGRRLRLTTTGCGLTS